MAKAKTTKKRTTTKNEPKSDEEVTACRRRDDRRETRGETAEDEPKERRKVQRRRQIDPTTCERDYTTDEIEFMHALDDYKRASGRMFPTCSEILEVVRNLGYARTGEPVVTPAPSVEGETEDSESLEALADVAEI